MFKNNITFIFGAYSLYNKYLTWSDPNVHHLTIGDEGPAGGVVFYIEEDGVTGLEAAPHDMDLVDDEGQWGCWGTNVPGAIRTEIGAGKANTTAIALNCPAARNAAVICVNYHYLEFQDWFLPSLKEWNDVQKPRQSGDLQYQLLLEFDPVHRVGSIYHRLSERKC